MRTLGLLRSIVRNRRRAVDLPRFLTYIVTFYCNARCIMCDSWKKPSPDDLSLDEIEKIYAQLPQMDAVRLTGGEPFVRADLLEITHLTQRMLKPLAVHITTNGFLTDRIVKFCEQRDKSVPLQVLVSVDGVGEKHNHIRGQKFAWANTLETVKALAARRRELRLSLAVNQTIVDAEGAAQYPQLREILKPLGVANHIVMAYDASATYSLDNEVEIAPEAVGKFTTFGEFTRAQMVALLDEVERDIEEYPLPERVAKRYYVRGIRNRLLHEQGTPNPPCVALSTHMRLYPNGDVPTCQFNSKRVGNLRKQTFDELWGGGAGTKMDAQRKWVRDCPGCWAECEVLPSAIYTGDIARAVT